MTLEPGHFSAFFDALWGYQPFPWQQQLLEEVADTGAYPDVLALGTGTGKTSIIDIHVFAQALDAARPPAERRLPRRLFFVVDRRVIVDQTAQHADRIAAVLAGARGGVLGEVAEALRQLADTREPLATATLRGGVVRDASWIRWPDQPLVVSSTVDQVGSRLLFRGYGVSEGMTPIHAALVGADSLIVLDEVHLALPFRQTLDAIAQRTRRADRRLPDRWHILTMSATPSDARGNVFRLGEADAEHPVLSQRLKADRPALLLPLKAKGSDTAADRKATVRACIDAVLGFLDEGHRAIGVVVNRVDIARDVWATLEKRREVKKARAEVALVTGRMRSLDKAATTAALHKVRAGRSSDEDPEKPVIIVSTQSIEAGADLDFDALVTQAASIDALQQRFGRLNRMGRFRAAEPPIPFGFQYGLLGDSDEPPEAVAAEGVILFPQPGSTDPIYGDAIDAAIAFLTQQGVPEDEDKDAALQVDFAIEQMEPALGALDETSRAAMSSPRVNAPVLLPTYMDLWTQTRPLPWPDPEVAPFLHGPQRAPDVQIIWRSELSADMLASLDSRGVRRLVALLDAAPPASVEALSVPIYAAVAWLNTLPAVTIADVPVKTQDPAKLKYGQQGRLALQWNGDASRVVEPSEIRVGDTLLLPSDYGGLNRVGVWDPGNLEPVTDLGDQAQWVSRSRAIIRTSLHGGAGISWVRRALADGSSETTVPFETKHEEREAISEWLADLEDGATPWLADTANHLRRVGWHLIVVDSASGGHPNVVLVNNRPKVAARDFEPEVSSHTSRGRGGPLSLDQHCRDVAGRASGFAQRLGLPDELVHDITLAGLLHDLGKADPRFQLLLAGGDPVKAAMLHEPLAKSGMSPGDREARDEAQRRSGYPRGTRHELTSLAIVLASGEVQRRAAFDPELVHHLIASHHGWCRPLAPPVPDPEPVSVPYLDGGHKRTLPSDHKLARVGSGVAERFATLNAKYGPHLLAWLETLVRLADHRASETPSQGGTP